MQDLTPNFKTDYRATVIMMDGVGTRMDMWVGGTELSPGTDPPVYGQFQQRYQGQFQKFNGERVVFSVNMLGVGGEAAYLHGKK